MKKIFEETNATVLYLSFRYVPSHRETIAQVLLTQCDMKTVKMTKYAGWYLLKHTNLCALLSTEKRSEKV